MAYEDKVFATFYDEAVQNKRETKDKGFPVFDEVLYILIKVPNQVDNVARPATDQDKQRFPKSWAAYETGKEPPLEGVPIEHWPEMTVGEVRTCQANGLKTVQQLADCADGSIHRLGMGGQDLKQRAIKYLARIGEYDSLKARIQELEAKLDERVKSQKPIKRRKVMKAISK